jgi:TRAP-type C4-dicarboxylate transport system permease small subunit
MLDAILDRVCRFLNLTIALALAIMVVLVFGNVVLRYVFNSGIAISEEMSRWLFVWITFLGGIAAIHENAHLGTDMLVSRLSAGGKKACYVLAHLIMIYLTWLCLKGSWQQTLLNADMAAPVTGISMALFYASGVVFSVCAGVLLVLRLFRVLSGGAKGQALVMSTESEESIASVGVRKV